MFTFSERNLAYEPVGALVSLALCAFNTAQLDRDAVPRFERHRVAVSAPSREQHHANTCRMFVFPRVGAKSMPGSAQDYNFGSLYRAAGHSMRLENPNLPFRKHQRHQPTLSANVAESLKRAAQRMLFPLPLEIRPGPRLKGRSKALLGSRIQSVLY
jgi:hypothetical protein